MATIDFMGLFNQLYSMPARQHEVPSITKRSTKLYDLAGSGSLSCSNSEPVVALKFNPGKRRVPSRGRERETSLLGVEAFEEYMVIDI